MGASAADCKAPAPAGGADLPNPWATADAAFHAQLAAWAEREAIRGADGLPEQLPAIAQAFADDHDGRGRKARPNADLTEPWDQAGPPDGAPLGLTREVISTSSTYLLAAAKVDTAFGLLAEQLRAAYAEANGWGPESMRHRARLLAKLESVERRRASLRRCFTGDLAVPRFVCSSGHVTLGAPMTCNVRVCPRCVSKLRRQAQAHVLDVLELVDQRRAREHRPPPRWRFLTLTTPSQPAFLPMRRMLGRAWGRILRRHVWTRNVTAAVLAWETTHTRAGWHVHAHALLDAFVPRPQLVREWQLAVCAEVFADAQDRRQVWTGDPLRAETVAACRRLLRRGRSAPCVRQAAQDGGGRLEVLGGDRAQHLVELAELAGQVLVQRTAADGTFEVDDLEPVTRDAAAMAQLQQLLALVPTGVGVHISEPKGSRSEIVRELAKYIAKDLAGAATDEDAGEEAQAWGVAGTPARLAEFVSGAFRWRTLRTYGEAFRALGELDGVTCAMTCCECGETSPRFEGVDWLTQQAAAAARVAARPRAGPLRGPPAR